MTHRDPPPHARYELLRQLGQSPLTRSFVALRRAPGRPGEPCVIELLHEQLAREEDLRALFLDQAAATLSQRHPLLARTLDVIVDGDGCGLAIEPLSGKTLASVISRVGRLRLPVDIHLHVLCQVLEALAAAHRHSLSSGQPLGGAHRDVCPRNVLLTHDGQVKLLGSGLGAVSRAAQLKWHRPWVDVRYAAPETLLGAPPEPSADVFSAGVMIWEAIARQPRIGAADESAAIERRITGNEPSLESVWPDAPQPLIDLCERALAHDPRARQSAEQLRAELCAHLARSGEPSQTVLARVPPLLERAFPGEPREVDASASTPAGGSEPPGRREADRAPAEGGWNDPTSPSLPRPSGLAPAGSPQGGGEPEPNPPSLAPSSREPDTGGHRAFATTLEPEPPRRVAWGAARPLFGPLLLLGALGAAVALVRGGPREERRAAAAAVVRPREASELRSESAGGAGRGAHPLVAADAGTERAPAAAPTSAPAFLEGLRRAEPPEEGSAPTIAADDLPPVDAARDSLQDAILRASKARRAAARRKRPRHGAARAAAPDPPAPALRLPAAQLPAPPNEPGSSRALPWEPEVVGGRTPGTSSREIVGEDPYAPPLAGPARR